MGRARRWRLLGAMDPLPLLFWGGIVFLIAWTVTRIFPKGRGDDRSEGPRDSAEEILRERFARGEINAEEYERSLEILRTGTAWGPPNKIPPGSAVNGKAKITSSIGKPRSCT